MDAESPKPLPWNIINENLHGISQFTRCFMLIYLILPTNTKVGIYFSFNKYLLNSYYVTGERYWCPDVFTGQVYFELLTAFYR